MDVPATRRIGTALLGGLAVLLATGVALSFLYDPDPRRAHASVRELGALGGWLRGVHAWGASITLALALAHGAAAWIRAGAPLTRRWLSGWTAAGLLLAWFYTGTVLPWDQQAWEAWQHGVLAAQAAGASGPERVEPEGVPLEWMFWIHVAAMPLVLALPLAAHLGGHRLTVGVRVAWWRLRTHWRLAAAVAAGAGLAALAAPASHGPAPVRDLEVSLPRWPFLWLVPVQDALGAAGMWALPVAWLAGAAVLWRSRWGARTRAGVLAGTLLVLLVASLIPRNG